MKFSELKENYKITEKDLMNFLPMEESLFEKTNIKVMALGYYLNGSHKKSTIMR